MSLVSVSHKLSLLHLQVYPELPETLNYDVYTRFADIMESTQSKLKLKISCYDDCDKIVLTRDEAQLIQRNYGTRVLYWKGYDAVYRQSNRNLLELNEKILASIIGFLDARGLQNL